MGSIDVEKVINGTPSKRILNGYEKLKKGYTKESAHDFYSTYVKESLSSILENSKYIFTEGYEGLDYYNNNILSNPSLCLFTKLNSEIDKEKNFFEAYSEKMNDNQRNKFKTYIEKVEDLIDKEKNVILIANYIKENIDSQFEDNLSKALYGYKLYKEGFIEDQNTLLNTIVSLFENVKDPSIAFLYLPFASNILGNNAYLLNESVKSKFSSDEIPFNQYVDTVTLMNKLEDSDFYKESVLECVRNKDVRIIIESYMKENLHDKISSLIETTPNDEMYIFHNNMERAIHEMYDDLHHLDTIFDKKNENILEKVYDVTGKLLLLEYQTSKSTDDIASGYSMIGEGFTLEEAVKELASKTRDTDFFLEAEDKELDDLSSEENDNKDNKNEYDIDFKRKIEKPEKPNLLNRIQIKAQDVQVQQNKKAAAFKKFGTDLKNAARSVLEIPASMVKGIKKFVHDVDTADDERRKAYMSEPGFRKKAFRNLKLAILYGGTALTNLAMLPVVMLARHWSKEKDIRIRNQMVKEIETNIKVCDAKIEDASAEGNKAEKYYLMRVKDQLEAEKMRVRLNTKYI